MTGSSRDPTGVSPHDTLCPALPGLAQMAGEGVAADWGALLGFRAPYSSLKWIRMACPGEEFFHTGHLGLSLLLAR